MLGDFQLLAKLATGGMAEIFLARRRDAAPDAPVQVIKRILPHLADDEHFITMFRDEANLAAQLVHPNICRVHELGRAGGESFIVMEYLHGVALSRLLSRLSKRRQFLDVRVVAGLCVQALAGLHHAHEARGPDGHPLGVVHRDVSPPNIVVTGDGVVKLLDFGIAKARGANSKTRTGTVKGKNAYMSPEQILGKPLDRRSDVFALAAVMYELLSVRRLFHRDSDFLTFKAITEEAIPDIRDRRSDLPASLVAVLTRALARDPSARYATAADMSAAITAAVSILGGPASPDELRAALARDFAEELTNQSDLLAAAERAAASGAAPLAPLRVSGSAPTPPEGTTRPASDDGDFFHDRTPVARARGAPPPVPARRPTPPPVGGRTRAGGTRPPSIVIEDQPSGPVALPAGAPGAATGAGGGAAGASGAAAGASTASAGGSPTPGTGLSPFAPGAPSPFSPGAPSPFSPGAPSPFAAAGSSASPAADPLAPSSVTAAPTGVTMMDLADPSTDLLRDWRRRRMWQLVAAGVLATGAMTAFLFTRDCNPASTPPTELAATAADAGEPAIDAGLLDAPTDADPTRADIVALARFGFFSIGSEREAKVYIDDKLVGDAPLIRYPLSPGPHEIKLRLSSGRRKSKTFDVIIEATKDVDLGVIDW